MPDCNLVFEFFQACEERDGVVLWDGAVLLGGGLILLFIAYFVFASLGEAVVSKFKKDKPTDD